MSLDRISSYPGGFDQGVLIQNIPIAPVHSGNNYYVDSNGQTSSKGTWKQPFATVLEAIAAATENNGDTIYIKEGHAEALTATSFAIDKAGLKIIGLGTGSRVPAFTTAVVGGVGAITAANTVLSNIRLICNYTGGSTNAITVSAAADYCTLDRIVCRDTTNAKEWLIHISVATTVTDLKIQNCDLIGLAGGTGTNSILFAGTTSNVKILGNYIDADMSDSLVDHDAGKATNILVAHNLLLNADTDATTKFCVELEATSTGLVAGNLASYANAGAACYIGEAAFFVESYGGNTAGSSGELDPAAVAIP